MFVYECPKQYMIPIYLAVSGCVVMIRGLISILELYFKKKAGYPGDETPRKKVFKAIDAIAGIFLFSWFIAGQLVGFFFSVVVKSNAASMKLK